LQPLIRFVLDAVYTIVFFAVTTAGAIGLHVLTKFAEQMGVDPPIVVMLRAVEWLVAGGDCIGTICGTAFSLYRFVHLLRKESAPPSREAL
jgi:DMSO reductase anchor subunit